MRSMSIIVKGDGYKSINRGFENEHSHRMIQEEIFSSWRTSASLKCIIELFHKSEGYPCRMKSPMKQNCLIITES